MKSRTVFPIAIVGGGPGGLVLARILQMHGVEAVLFEREVSRDARPQGGSLDLHVESGQQALREAGLEAEFQSIARYEGQDLRILDKYGKVHWEEVAEQGPMNRPEVDRSALRDILLDSIKPDVIRWNHALKLATRVDHDVHELHFQNGEVVTAGLVIGADGARSRVRPLLTDAQPLYSGVSFVEVGIPDADTQYPEISKFVGRGSVFALEDNKAIKAQRNGNGRIHVYVAFRVEKAWLAQSGLVNSSADQAREVLLSHFTDWAPEVVGLIRYGDQTILSRPIDILPIGLTWPSQRGITLIGDAAHLMSPFAGEGANVAMLDGARLAAALAQYPDPDQAISVYESDMFVRAKKATEESMVGMDVCISPDGARSLAQLMLQYHQAYQEQLLAR